MRHGLTILTFPKVGYLIGPSKCAPSEMSLVMVPWRSTTLNESMGEYPVERRASLRVTSGGQATGERVDASLRRG